MANNNQIGDDMFVFSKRFATPVLFILPLFVMISCNGEEEVQPDADFELSSHEAFFETVRSLCGQEFHGETTFPNDPEHELAGAELYIHVASCEDNEIRIPFHVDENRSRTWILTFDEDGLLLKHDHRHADGTPEELTNYGGYADHRGDAFRQYFPADEETADMLPAAATNVWMMEVDLDDMNFTYYLERDNSPRYRAEFSLLDGVDSDY